MIDLFKMLGRPALEQSLLGCPQCHILQQSCSLVCSRPENVMFTPIVYALSTALILPAAPPTVVVRPGGTVVVFPGPYAPYYYPRYAYPVNGTVYVDPSANPYGTPMLTVLGNGSAPTTVPARTLIFAPTPIPQPAVLNPVFPFSPPAIPSLQATQPAAPAYTQVDVATATQQLNSPRERERLEAVVALGRSQSPKATETLQQVLAADPSPRVREAAARGLGVIGSQSSLKALQVAAQADEDKDVRRSAQFAAETIRITQK